MKQCCSVSPDIGVIKILIHFADFASWTQEDNTELYSDTRGQFKDLTCFYVLCGGEKQTREKKTIATKIR